MDVFSYLVWFVIYIYIYLFICGYLYIYIYLYYKKLYSICVFCKVWKLKSNLNFNKNFKKMILKYLKKNETCFKYNNLHSSGI